MLKNSYDKGSPVPWRPPAPTVRRRPARRPLPAHLPRHRVVYPAPTACPGRGHGDADHDGEAQ
ncbi:hypothetical protein [Constrictibacter sp. MBR-5]|uniref:hypothetical protein n=1 Tax=Constrictibacter sp. MBR-5 TaxID=3156467 RepID=UPI00339A0AAE